MRRWRGARGQALVEYLMICGLVLAIGIAAMKKMKPAAVKNLFQAAIECAISDVCPNTSVVVDPLNSGS